ncbi:PRD domain-containing protein [Fusibacter sp. Q10-2]|uniref:PRD domain-containing protein n=2 Tax=Fusibacter ferrireducens TaxID=2785058 RepID=A0ABR9ZTK1_9FIRM|nr:PRD domain-containing protein [Fusibacter ferrireducens]
MNHNVILANEHDSDQEVILIGKGLGFNRKAGQTIFLEDHEIDRTFRTYDEKYKEHYLSLLKGIDSAVLGVCAEIVSEAEKEFGQISQKLFLVLSDHISFALERIKNGLDISNPFLYEIKMLYSEEYKMGLKAQQMISHSVQIEIPESEVGFIALHIHAARHKKDVKDTVKNTRIIKSLIEIIEKKLAKKMQMGTLIYDRLVSHLWYCLDRIEKGEAIENPLGDTVKIQFPEAFAVSEKMVEYIEKSLNKKVSKNEMVYMTLHIDRIRRS